MRKKEKGKRFEALISRADLALELKFYLEASWIIYALIEERLKSLAIKRFHLSMNRENFDGCIQSLQKELLINTDLSKYLDNNLLIDINKWRLERNKIMHDLAKEEIDYDKIKKMAISGRELFAKLATAIMKIKRKKL